MRSLVDLWLVGVVAFFSRLLRVVGWSHLVASMRWLLTLAVLCSALGSVLLGAAIAAPLALPIDQARQQPDSVEVVVVGRVTVPSGWFESANLDRGFALQDQSGGIFVSADRDVGLQTGEVVEVVGPLQDDGHGQRVVRLKAWHLRDLTLPKIAPQVASVHTAATELEGQLVTVQGTIARPLVEDAPYGDRLWIEDDTGIMQIYIPRSTGISPQDLPFLQSGHMIRVTGLSSQYDLIDEVMPRQVEDIRPVG